MRALPESDGNELITMIENILENSRSVIDLNFFCFSRYQQHGQRLMEAILSMSEHSKLYFLDLGSNSDWWRNAATFSLLLNIVEQKQYL